VKPDASDNFDLAVCGAEAAADELGTPDAHRDLGRLYFADDRFSDAMRQFEIAFRQFRDAGRLCEAARMAIQIASTHISVAGNASAGNGWMHRARTLLERVGPCVEWGYLELTALSCDRPDIEQLLASADRALDVAIEFGDSDLEAQAMADSGLALVTMGRTAEGFGRLDAALAAISANEVSTDVAGLCFCAMLTACDRSADVRRAREWTALFPTMMMPGVGERPKVLYTHCRLAYGSVLCAAGRWAEGEEQIVSALGPRENPTPAHRPTTVARLAALRVQQGRVEEAAALLTPFEDHIECCGPQAMVHLGRGRPELAVIVLHRGLKELVADALRITPLLSLLVVAELERGDVEAAHAAAVRLGALADDVDVAFVRAEAAVARARVGVTRGDQVGAIELLERAISLLARAERPLELAIARLELAEALARSGNELNAVVEGRSALVTFERLGATTCRDRASALLRSLGDSGRVAATDGRDLTTLLSAREQEVLELVSHGLSNGDIAARLFISPKTAEHHVGRILAKLGVRSRAEAAALAVRLAATANQ